MRAVKSERVGYLGISIQLADRLAGGGARAVEVHSLVIVQIDTSGHLKSRQGGQQASINGDA